MILKFPTVGDRIAFIDRLDRTEPDLIPHIKFSYSQPDLVIVRTRDDAVLRRLQTIARDLAVVHADVQFETFGVS